MHIPDGYLSPSTCAALYAGAAPFWYVALRRVEHLMHTRLVAVIALFAAFSFVVMMFNLPLPGGTTGHAVGIGVATVVLGPWGSMLAISLALFIQAILFGDGGITALGANCLNMAVAGSFVAHVVYRSLAGRSAIESRRRVVAAALAGYAAVNVSALMTALEFGVQPLLFRDPATGAPLYAPYPPRIAIAAMMIGHLTVAGIAEALLCAGLVRHLQRADPALLLVVSREEAHVPRAIEASPWHTTARLWGALAVAMMLVPLGLLAAGRAWGEWTVAELADPSARAAIASASAGIAPPAEPPHGLARLASLWTAPIPDYAPAFLRRPALGYVMSAMLGVGAILGLLVAVAAARDLIARRAVRR